MMRFDGDVIVGASVWSAGLILNGNRQVLVVDRGASVGSEYFDCFRPLGAEKREFRTEAARELAAELSELGKAEDFYGAAPLLYRELKEHAGQFRLWLEITAVRPAGSGWAVDLADAAGVSTIECRRVIDCTPECVTNPEFHRNNLTELRLSAAIHADAPEALREWNRPDFLTVRPGRRADELLLTLALLTAIALTIFMLEAQIPAPVPIPGVKLGLANIVTVFTVFLLGPGEGCLVLAARIFLGAVFAGNFSTILYSAAGGGLAILVTILLRRVLKENQLWVAGCAGAAAHSVGQMAVAVCISGTPALLAYLPILIAISLITGLFTGLCAQFLLNRGKNFWKTILK